MLQASICKAIVHENYSPIYMYIFLFPRCTKFCSGRFLITSARPGHWCTNQLVVIEIVTYRKYPYWCSDSGRAAVNICSNPFSHLVYGASS